MRLKTVSSSSSFNHLCFGLFLRMQRLKRSKGAMLSRSSLIPLHSSPCLLRAIPWVLALVAAAVNYLRLLLACVQLPTKGKWSHSEWKTTNWGLLLQWFLHCDMPGRPGGLYQWIVIFKNMFPKIRRVKTHCMADHRFLFRLPSWENRIKQMKAVRKGKASAGQDWDVSSPRRPRPLQHRCEEAAGAAGSAISLYW